jgi:hypothetical protein
VRLARGVLWREDMMLWTLVAVPAAFLVFPRLARGRRGRRALLPFDPISTLQVEMLRKQSRKTKAALDAATRLLH